MSSGANEGVSEGMNELSALGSKQMSERDLTQILGPSICFNPSSGHRRSRLRIYLCFWIPIADFANVTRWG